MCHFNITSIITLQATQRVFYFQCRASRKDKNASQHMDLTVNISPPRSHGIVGVLQVNNQQPTSFTAFLYCVQIYVDNGEKQNIS